MPSLSLKLKDLCVHKYSFLKATFNLLGKIYLGKMSLVYVYKFAFIIWSWNYHWECNLIKEVGQDYRQIGHATFTHCKWFLVRNFCTRHVTKVTALFFILGRAINCLNFIFNPDTVLKSQNEKFKMVNGNPPIDKD